MLDLANSDFSDEAAVEHLLDNDIDDVEGAEVDGDVGHVLGEGGHIRELDKR